MIGQVVGSYINSSGVYIGFERSGGKFTTIAVPFTGATNTYLIANNDAGEIVVHWTHSSGATHAFTLIADTYASFDYHGATRRSILSRNEYGDGRDHQQDQQCQNRNAAQRERRSSVLFIANLSL